MQITTLKMNHHASDELFDAASHALLKIRGVQGVKALNGDESAIAVEFDEQHTGRQELIASLKRAGFSLPAEPGSESERQGCCGGCCR